MPFDCDAPASAAVPCPPELLLLADGRFPAGSHAHSGGMEAAAALEGVRELGALETFLTGRLHTAGLVAAAYAAATCAACQDGAAYDEPAAQRPDMDGLHRLDEEFHARTPSSALRTASRRLGRQMLRAGRTVWPHPLLDALAAFPGGGPHQPVALGAVAASAGLRPEQASLAAAHDAVTGPATAAVRLLAFDPFAVHALMARLGGAIATVASHGASHARTDPAELPASAGPLLDVSAERHASWEVRLFAS